METFVSVAIAATDDSNKKPIAIDNVRLLFRGSAKRISKADRAILRLQPISLTTQHLYSGKRQVLLCSSSNYLFEPYHLCK
ncbi:MAG TPA: hypothetical protein V6D11_19060 [Waterburya sp.]